MKLFGDIRLEVDSDAAYIHLPERVETIRIFHGDSGVVNISAADGNLEVKVLQPQEA